MRVKKMNHTTTPSLGVVGGGSAGTVREFRSRRGWQQPQNCFLNTGTIISNIKQFQHKMWAFGGSEFGLRAWMQRRIWETMEAAEFGIRKHWSCLQKETKPGSQYQVLVQPPVIRLLSGHRP